VGGLDRTNDIGKLLKRGIINFMKHSNAQGCVILDQDGYPVTQAFTTVVANVEEKQMAAASIAMFLAATKSCKILGFEDLDTLIMRSTNGTIICKVLKRGDEGIVISALLEKDTPMGLVLYELENLGRYVRSKLNALSKSMNIEGPPQDVLVRSRNDRMAMDRLTESIENLRKDPFFQLLIQEVKRGRMERG